MSASNLDTAVVTSSPWFQGDYRSSSPFRGKHVADIKSDWTSTENSDQTHDKNEQAKFGKYSLVIVIPPTTSDNSNTGSEEAIGQCNNNTNNVQADSGVGSMSPSPPKTPTPDYDSLEDMFDEDYYAAGIVEALASASLPVCGSSTAKKVHFSMASDSSEESDDKSPTAAGKTSWRDALVVSPIDYQDHLTFCYRQEWVKGEARSKSKTLSMHPILTTTLLTEDLDQGQRSRTETRKRSNTKLVRRSSSLDRLAELRYSYRNVDRSPLLCDPDPLKAPTGTTRKNLGRRAQRQAAVESSSHKPVERASCGPGPPLKQLRSYSVENNSNNGNFASSQLGRARQRSVSGNVSTTKKTPVRRVDDDALKRSRLHSSQYELSQDLLDKQVEMLERKYGGVCARKAALTIQRAFRKYTIMKRFQDIANASKGEKRLSRRFPTFDVENKEWVVYNNNGTVSRYPHFQHHPSCYEGDSKVCNNYHHSDVMLQSNYNVLYRELSENLDTGDSARYIKPCRTQSFRERRTKYEEMYSQGQLSMADRNNTNGYEQQYYMPRQISHLNSAYYQEAYQSSPAARSPPSFPRHPAWTAVPNANVQRTHHCSSPNQLSSVYVNSSPIVKTQQDGYQPPRDSVSSEDSALSLMSIEIESNEPDSSIHRGSAVRHSINVSPSKQSSMPGVLQRTGIRASDMALGRRVMGRSEQKKIPPQVPKRTSSIPSREDGSDSQEVLLENSQSLQKTASNKTVDASPVWKRKSLVLAEQSISVEDKRLSNISENSEDSLDSGGGYSNTPPADMSHSFNVHNYPDVRTPHELPGTPSIYKLTEIQRKRQYRVGLNLFNKKPERGIRYLIQRGFLEAAPQAVARFLLTRKGLSKQMIGEYLGNLQNSFNMAVLECFVQELDLAGMQVDVALRKFQTFFRMPGEAQKIERLVEVFSHRYIDCNHDIASKFHNPDTVFVLAFAIIMLNTDLHTPNMKAERRMKLEEFIRNLRSIDDGHDLDRDMLVGIYERIKTNEFKMGSDHVTQVLKVQQTIVGKKPNLALPHRRLVCYCRLYEVYDVSKKERPGVHQREVFLFNDLLMVTKIFSKKKNSVTYTFRQSFPLCGMSVTLFEAPYYPHGIRLSQRVDDKVLITFNARNEHDRSKFVEDLKESILEMDEMENLRIEGELEKQKMMRVRGAENRDSGVADMEIIPQTSKDGKLSPESAAAANNLKRSALSNSLLDLHEQQINKPVRRGSAGSLDSGMSISFQSSAASSVSHDSSPQIVHASSTSSGSGSSLGSTRSGPESSKQQQQPTTAQAGFLGGWFGKKSKNISKGNLRKPLEGQDTS